MIERTEHDELLLELARETGLCYLSDLGMQVQSEKLRQVIRSIPEAKYDVREWCDAVHYLIHRHGIHAKTFKTVADAKQYLLRLQL